MVRRSPLLVGTAAGLLGAVLLAPATGSALGRLRTARAEQAAAQATVRAASTAVPLVPAALSMPAADAAAARRAIAGRVERLAKAGGVLVEARAGVEAPAGLVVLRIRVSGGEKAVLALADAMERERPLVRFRDWQVEPIAGGGIRLTGEAMAAWR